MASTDEPEGDEYICEFECPHTCRCEQEPCICQCDCVGCPLIFYTDLDPSFCKTIEEIQLVRPGHSS